jgi:integrase
MEYVLVQAGGLIALPQPLGDAPVPLTRHWLRDVWYAACEAAKVDRVRLHDLRHCHGQWTLDAGIGDSDVIRYMGHATSHMTQRYRRRQERVRNSEAIAKVLGVPLNVPQAVSRKQNA